MAEFRASKFVRLQTVFGFFFALSLSFSAFGQKVTQTLLNVSVGGAPVVTVPAKTAVTLTATITVGVSPVAAGQVLFCDAAYPHCTDIHIVGAAQITSAGAATFKFVPGSGTHTYKAIFFGTNTDATSTSANAVLTVLAATGPITTTVGIQSTGVPGDYSLLATVASNGPASPTGQVGFLDTSNSNYNLGNATLGPTGSSNISFLNTENFPLPRGNSGAPGDGGVAVGDFNGDGIPDIIVANPSLQIITVLLGIGDGTFRTGSVISPSVIPGLVVAGDFNHDGKLDFVVVSTNGVVPGLVVYLGNGDGTFTALPPIVINDLFGGGLVVADFNGDGILDIAVSEVDPASAGTGACQLGMDNCWLQVLLGNGDGTFTAIPNRTPTIFPFTLISADFNGDGKPDLAVTGDSAYAVILLGNGDGTFTAAPNVVGGLGIVAADLNGDGIPDLVINNQASTFVLLGKGDGTFTQLADNPALDQQAASLGVGDFNGDGIPDLVIPDVNGGYTDIFMGKGDGTFTSDAFAPSLAGYIFNQVAVADFNGDGQSDFAAAINDDNTYDNPPMDQLSIFLAQSPSTAATYLYNVSPVGTGYHYVEASYPGDSNNQPGVSGTVALLAEQVPTSLTLTANPSSSVAGQQVTLTATLNPFLAQDHYASGSVSFTSGSTILGSASVSNGVATLMTTALAVGTDRLKASYPGDVNFTASTSAVLPYSVVTPVSQTINFPPPTSPAYAGTSVTLTATATSGLPVTYTVVSGPATVDGSTLTYIGVGTVLVQASQSGGGPYEAALPIERSVAVTLLTEPVGTMSPVLTTVVTFSVSGILNTLEVLTQGAQNLDFNLVSGGSCTVGTAYIAGQTCTVEFTFKPTLPGIRYGGITLSANSGELLANSYIYGEGVGPQVNYLPGVQSILASGFTQPSGLAFDGSGNLFVADGNGNAIRELLASSGYTSITTVGSGFVHPVGVAVDGSGNLFVAENNTVSDIKKVFAVGGYTTIIPVGSGFSAPAEVAVDGNGNVFVADMGSNSVKEVPVSSGYSSVVTIGNGFSEPTGVAVDGSGNVFVADYGHSQVKEILAASSYTNVFTFPGLYAFVTALSINAAGDVFVVSLGSDTAQEIFAAGGYATATTLASSLPGPEGIALDGLGNVYFSDYLNQTVVKLDYADAPTLSFANTAVGSTSSDSPQTVTFINNGTANLSFSVPTTGNNPTITTGFKIGSSSTCPQLTTNSSVATLAPGSTCTDAISFSPLAGGPYSGKLITTDNNLDVVGATQTVLLNGVGTTIAPTITFVVPNQTYGNPPFTVAAASNSSGAFTYSVLSGPATISGATVTLTGTGTVELQVFQAANGIYSSGTQTATFIVSKESQTITFAALASPVNYGTPPVTLSATASSGLSVTFSVLSGPATVSGNTLTFTGIGTVVVAADQAGNADYNPAPEVTHTVIVIGRIVTIGLTATPNPVFVQDPVTLTATVSSSFGTPTGTMIFLDGSKPIGSAGLNGGAAAIAISTLNVGTHSITASYSGDSSFAPLVSTPVIVVVQDFSLVINNPNVTIPHGGTAVYNLVVSSVGTVGMAANIGFTIAGSPDHSGITFSPQVIPTGSGTTNVTLTIQTPDYPVGPWSQVRGRGGITLALAILGVLVLPFGSKKRFLGIQMRQLACMASLLFALTSLSGCGGVWKTQSYSITVTASSGSLSHSVNASLISQQ